MQRFIPAEERGWDELLYLLIGKRRKTPVLLGRGYKAGLRRDGAAQ